MLAKKIQYILNCGEKTENGAIIVEIEFPMEGKFNKVVDAF